MLIEKKTCRDELLIAVLELIKTTGKNEFTINEVITFMNSRGTTFKKSTIRIHIKYRCCANAKKRYHATNYDDLIMLENGSYSLNNI
ncbi:hypothetical protein CD31_01135 [Lysinibacillus boronitolerans JCM 21713 = 10a = NBRC 103108]|uniref:DUF7669 domain-containing protein n=1 Tax=Lysinibacillus boronitolerans JCM 21713 = 10a = NBRC 103108 TaxID=1294264 RepID=A0ABR4Y4Q8_9BACI|nr:hypothetical protein CD31_01135 [Lysinibacillus boronitolerans JCM 21713 = 10a = NBRC 103108]